MVQVSPVLKEGDRTILIPLSLMGVEVGRRMVNDSQTVFYQWETLASTLHRRVQGKTNQ